MQVTDNDRVHFPPGYKDRIDKEALKMIQISKIMANCNFSSNISVLFQKP
jgi:hypothetical protein